MKKLEEILNQMPDAATLKRLLQMHPVNSYIIARSQNKFYKFQLVTIDRIRWHELQTIVNKGRNRPEKEWLLFLYFQQAIAADDIGFRGKIVGTSYEKLLRNEKEEIDLYISIFRENNFSFHYQVNEFITKSNLWDNFKKIRSINFHESGAELKGIAPKYFAIVCSLLELSNFTGSKLESYESW